MLSVYRYFYRDELVELAETIPEPDKLSLFLDTVANNTNLHKPGQDGKVWVRLYLDSSDGDWVQKLVGAARVTLSRANFDE